MYQQLQEVTTGRKSKDAVLITNLKDIWQKRKKYLAEGGAFSLQFGGKLDTKSTRLALFCFVRVIKEPEFIKAYFPYPLSTLRLHLQHAY